MRKMKEGRKEGRKAGRKGRNEGMNECPHAVVAEWIVG